MTGACLLAWPRFDSWKLCWRPLGVLTNASADDLAIYWPTVKHYPTPPQTCLHQQLIWNVYFINVGRQLLAPRGAPDIHQVIEIFSESFMTVIMLIASKGESLSLMRCWVNEDLPTPDAPAMATKTICRGKQSIASPAEKLGPVGISVNGLLHLGQTIVVHVPNVRIDLVAL